MRGAQCVNSHLEAGVPEGALVVDRCNFFSLFSLSLSLPRPICLSRSLSPCPLAFPARSASAVGRPRSETQRVHRNRRGPRVTNASKMDKGYTWPPDGRRRHALLLLSLSAPLALMLPYARSLVRSRRSLPLPTDKSRFYPSVHTCPSPTRMHVVTAVTRSEGRKCTRITPDDAGGAEDVGRVRERERERRRHCRNRSVEHPKPPCRQCRDGHRYSDTENYRYTFGFSFGIFRLSACRRKFTFFDIKSDVDTTIIDKLSCK